MDLGLVGAWIDPTGLRRCQSSQKKLNIFGTDDVAKQISSTHSHSHFVVCCRMINCMKFNVKVMEDGIDCIVQE